MKTAETLDQPEKGNFHLQKMILLDKNQGSRIDEVNDFKLGSIESNDHDEKNSNITKPYKERSQSLKVVNRNELLDEKVVHMIISRSEKAEKYRSAVVSIKEAINRHWQELEELRRNKEMEERDTVNHLKISIKKISLSIREIETELAVTKKAELVGIRPSKKLRRKSSTSNLWQKLLLAEITPRAWDRFEDTKSAIALIVDSMLAASEQQSRWDISCNEKQKEIEKEVRWLLKVALAPLPIYRTWTKKSREKTVRLEKEIVMLRQLLDNAIPEDGNNYLTVVSEGLREIEGVVKQLQIGETRWIQTEASMINELVHLRDRMYNVPRSDAKVIILTVILDPLKKSIAKLQKMVE